MSWPTYDELPQHEATKEPIAWSVFGAEDELGTLNFMTPATVYTAASSVEEGTVYSLNLPIDYPDPPLFGRHPVSRVMVPINSGTDDYYNSFFPQGSSQWDGLSHVCHPDVGFYNGRTHAQITSSENPRNGIEHWSRMGIVGRYVLVDVARYRSDTGRPTDFEDPLPTTAEEIEAVLAGQRTVTQPGDILLLRFGWLEWYASLSPKARQELSARFHFPCPGLSQERSTARWLWNRTFVAVAADTPTLEAMPFDKSTFDGFLHYRLIPMLGMPIGELFSLDALAAACAVDGRYTGLLTSAPLNLRGGSGSTANALAVR